eukprot:CAMPEP_0198316982 /NCGR_PEP_ID=MMETSP1450-20131203/6651_1 /TAXON_ID=753684 ORGANISM="Madagascaria erythrocladiodes, Strain CCMP3234" /NCGR_SAMPLE_ID=MMETSP1450 /ASSEMBLY_ACC=CAM_ASM_001115 /LENGTH=377 /DNA_ID=CAMNT_0044020163 /DNA_START=244 /DNA_END=1377 /DNA_ORIENTATION=+
MPLVQSTEAVDKTAESLSKMTTATATSGARAATGMAGPVKIGVIGCGRIGQVHMRALSTIAEARVTMCADFFVKAAQSAASKFGVPVAVQDWKELVASPEVHGVIVCSPSDTHAEIIIAAANAGKHIFCEKPIDYELGRIDEALAAVNRANGVKLQLGFQRRFDSNFRRVRDAVHSGEVGEPFLMNITSRDPAPPPIDYIKQSGGLFFDMMIHDFDMARFVMGCEAVEVTATATSFDPAISEAGDVTTAVVTIQFENGAVGTISCCRKAVYGYDQRIEVLGSGGSVEIGNNFPNTAVVSTGSEVKRDLPLNFFMDRYVEAYQREMESFVQVIKEDLPVPVTGMDGRVPVVMAYAAKKSYEERRAVKISEIMYGASRL